MRHKVLSRLPLLLLLLLIHNSHQEIRDASFIRFCDNVGGQFAQSSHQTTTTPSLQYTSGDTCTVVWPVPAETQKEAEEYCHLWNMYPIAEAKLTAQGNPECKYENVFECRPDYTLFKGHCYKMVTNKFVTYVEANKMCTDEKVTSLVDPSKRVSVEVVKMYEQNLIRFFKAYFTDMGMFFIQNIPDMISNLKIEYMGDGDNYALAFGLAPVYKTGQGAVIRLPKNTLARVMCAYQAEETLLSLSYKARAFAPYYYPTADNGQVWRTASHVTVHNPQLDTYYNPSKSCEALMRSLVGRDKGVAWDATKENVQKLDDTFKLATVKSLLSYFYCYVHDYGPSYKGAARAMLAKVASSFTRHLGCFDRPDVLETTHSIRSHELVLDHAPISVLFYPEAIDGFNIQHDLMKDVQSPVFCNLFYPLSSAPKKCEPGWKLYQRTNGLKVCHRVYFGTVYSFRDALKLCQERGGTLATFTTNDEYEFLMDLMGDQASGVWLGYKKKSECPLVKSYGRCTSSYIFEFVDPLFGEDTNSVRDVMATKWMSGEPNNQYKKEHCIHKWNRENGNKPLLNDISCEQISLPACVKAAT